MLAIPAIDIMGGRCVRLTSGDPSTAVTYGSPVEWAARWLSEGAIRLHVVDLDGAFAGAPRALGVLREICSLTPSLVVQYGGGLRTLEIMGEALQQGARFIILGSASLEPDLLRQAGREFGEHIVLALDVRDGKAAVNGWTRDGLDARQVVGHALDAGISTVIVTSVKNDGTFSGPDLKTALDVAALGMDVIVSGGVGSIRDIEAILDTKDPRLKAVIIGKSLYEGRLSLSSAIELLNGGMRFCQRHE